MLEIGTTKLSIEKGIKLQAHNKEKNCAVKQRRNTHITLKFEGHTLAQKEKGRIIGPLGYHSENRLY
jgi:hypothetical protein